MKFGKKIYEIETFGILVIGKSLKCINEFLKIEICLKGTGITLLKVYVDITKWVYIYEEPTPLTLPTTYKTYDNIAIEIMTSSKIKILMMSCSSLNWHHFLGANA